jgi:hypothetical protein
MSPKTDQLISIYIHLYAFQQESEQEQAPILVKRQARIQGINAVQTCP